MRSRAESISKGQIPHGEHARGAAVLQRDTMAMYGSSRASVPSVSSSRSLSIRKRPQSLPELYASYEYFFSMLYLKVMDTVPGFVRSFAMPSTPPHWTIMLGRLKTNHVRAYDGTKPDDVSLLKRLWAAHCRIAFRSDAPFTPIDGTWKEMGFQSNDPAKDFRGGGRLALEQLVYLTERHPQDWNRMLGGNDFLTAAAGINVTLRLMWLLDGSESRILGPTTSTAANTIFTAAKAKEQICRFIFSDDIHAVFYDLNEVYCGIMRLLFRRWTESSQNIMEFNSILTGVYGEAERLLYVCESLEEFCKLV